MVTGIRETPPRHWEDQMLLHVVQEDLARKNGWSDLRRLVLDLPCFDCSGVQHSGDIPTRECGHGRCKAHGIVARVQQEEGERAGDPSTTFVFAVNAGCPLPTRRFNDVVEAAEQYVRSDERRSEECNAGRGPRVMAAFCDGSSIIYYTASSGIDVS